MILLYLEYPFGNNQKTGQPNNCLESRDYINYIKEAMKQNSKMQARTSLIQKFGRKICERLNSQADIICPDDKLRVLAL
jgi:hypothetical protein